MRYEKQIYLSPYYYQTNIYVYIYIFISPQVCLNKFCCCLGSSEVKTIDTEQHLDKASKRALSFVGTEEYIAPEMIAQKGYSSSVDWWTYVSSILNSKPTFQISFSHVWSCYMLHNLGTAFLSGKWSMELPPSREKTSGIHLRILRRKENE